MKEVLKGTLIAIGGSFIFGVVVGGFFHSVEIYLVTIPLEFFGINTPGWKIILFLFWLVVIANVVKGLGKNKNE